MGLAERYVQLILAGLRAKVASGVGEKDDLESMERWDEHLDSVVYAINTRVLKVHRYTLCQLLSRIALTPQAYMVNRE